MIQTKNIKELINNIHNDFDKLILLRQTAKQELSEIDKELSNYYHNVEGIEINYMSTSHVMMVKLKEILIRRRDAKLNINLLESFITALERNIDKTKKRTLEITKRHNELLQEIIDRAK